MALKRPVQIQRKPVSELEVRLQTWGMQNESFGIELGYSY